MFYLRGEKIWNGTEELLSDDVSIHPWSTIMDDLAELSWKGIYTEESASTSR
jgi:hypothetical protein